MPELKRPAPTESTALMLAKRSRNELVATKPQDGSVLQSGPPRTSNMDAPIMLLTGHEGEIYSAKFHPEGQFLASAGFDRQILFWKVYGECENFHAMSPSHSGAIVDLHFTHDGGHIFTASTDKTVGMYDTVTCQRIKRLKGHTGYVNSCSPGPSRGAPLVASASDDCSIKIWDTRHRGAVLSLNSTYQVTAVTFGDNTDQIISGGIDNVVKVWDLRKPSGETARNFIGPNHKPVHELAGHTDTVTGLAISPDGSYVLSNAMDNTLRVWDVRPFVTTDRCVKIITGHKHNFEKNLLHCSWSPDGAMVAAGSADRFVYIWDTTSRRIVYKLPGHLGSVNDVDFHKEEPIVLSAGSDKQIFLGEFEG